ncbi:hypothetical protein DFJ73DRAFT_819553 [Zopfochytrium polystomum]|nr:hypothetical protein DFJ73DRAFT_819553 [Zopfochytrium polystomum]
MAGAVGPIGGAPVVTGGVPFGRQVRHPSPPFSRVRAQRSAAPRLAAAAVAPGSPVPAVAALTLAMQTTRSFSPTPSAVVGERQGPHAGDGGVVAGDVVSSPAPPNLPSMTSTTSTPFGESGELAVICEDESGSSNSFLLSLPDHRDNHTDHFGHRAHPFSFGTDGDGIGCSGDGGVVIGEGRGVGAGDGVGRVVVDTLDSLEAAVAPSRLAPLLDDTLDHSGVVTLDDGDMMLLLDDDILQKGDEQWLDALKDIEAVDWSCGVPKSLPNHMECEVEPTDGAIDSSLTSEAVDVTNLVVGRKASTSEAVLSPDVTERLAQGQLAVAAELPRLKSSPDLLEAPKEQKDSAKAKVYVHKACVNCKTSHVACDISRPCQRCVRLGKAETCVDAERKKRGRPCNAARRAALEAAALATSTAASHKETTVRNATPSLVAVATPPDEAAAQLPSPVASTDNDKFSQADREAKPSIAGLLGSEPSLDSKINSNASAGNQIDSSATTSNSSAILAKRPFPLPLDSALSRKPVKKAKKVDTDAIAVPSVPALALVPRSATKAASKKLFTATESTPKALANAPSLNRSQHPQVADVLGSGVFLEQADFLAVDCGGELNTSFQLHLVKTEDGVSSAPPAVSDFSEASSPSTSDAPAGEISSTSESASVSATATVGPVATSVEQIMRTLVTMADVAIPDEFLHALAAMSMLLPSAHGAPALAAVFNALSLPDGAEAVIASLANSMQEVIMSDAASAAEVAVAAVVEVASMRDTAPIAP